MLPCLLGWTKIDRQQFYIWVTAARQQLKYVIKHLKIKRAATSMLRLTLSRSWSREYARPIEIMCGLI